MLTRSMLLMYLIATGLLSCQKERQDKPLQNKAIQETEKQPEIVSKATLEKLLSDNIKYFSDSVLHKDRRIMQAYINRYQPDSCGYNFQDRKRLKEDFEGFKPLSDINGDGKNDTLFIVPPFSMCDYDGRSYYFTDTSLPRLYTDTFCNGLNYFFVLPDIDEDGIKEIGYYHTTCVSRVKRIYLYTLKNNDWVEIGSGAFDAGMKDPTKTDFKKLVIKTGKKKFKVCDFVDGKIKWQSFEMK